MRKLITKKDQLLHVLLAVVLMLCQYNGARAQTRIITGTVTDSKGEALIGVSVKVKGEARGVSTDVNGKYRLNLSSANSVLVFSYIGFTTKEIALGDKAVVNVSLAESASKLNEVVVVGFGTARRADLTGSVGSVPIEDMQKSPVKSLDEALAGRVAGVRVTSSEGQPGAPVDIVVRGYNSITQNNYPLFVIDGFPMEDVANSAVNPLNTIDLNDIESIDILKDASATAIWGARGANGVVMVTTKRGKAGRSVITFDGYYGVQNNKKRMEVLSPMEFVKMQNEIDPDKTPLIYGEKDPVSNKMVLDLEKYRNVKGVNWEDQVTKKDAAMQNYYLSLTGGNEKTKYSASLSTLSQDGIILNSGFNRTQGRVALDQEVSKILKVGFNGNYSYLKNYGSPSSTGSYNNEINLLFNVWAYRPITTNGNVTIDQLLELPVDPEVATANDFRFNPVLTTQNELRENYSNSFNTNGYAEFTLSKALKFKVMGGYSNGVRRYDVFNGSMSRFGNPQTNFRVNGSRTFLNSNSWQNTNTLTYNKRINKKDLLTAVGGFSFEGNKNSTFGGTSVLLPNEGLGLNGLDEGTFNNIASAGSENYLASGFARLNYNINSKYLFTASYRADGSSRFPNNRWGYFPSGSFAWVFGREKFLKSNPVLSNGKLRTSWGRTGNNGVGNYAAFPLLALTTTSGYMFNNTATYGSVPASLGNSDLKWETTTQTDIGLDLGFLQDRISLTADIYRKNTSDLLLNADLPASIGYSKATKNIGKVRNEGLELTLSANPVKNKNFSWNSQFNISFNRNKVLGLTENQNYMLTSQYWGDDWVNIFPYVAMLDKPISQFYGYIWDGTYKYEDFVKTGNTYTLKNDITANGEARASVQPGDIKYRDVNGDLVIDEKDKVIIGQPYPKHTGGFTNNFNYKGFSLNVFFQWSYGNDVLNANRLMLESGYKYNTNQYATYANRWSPENPDSDIPAVRGSTMKAYSTRIIEDGSFLRLKTVALGYTLPQRLSKAIQVSSLGLTLTAQNLYTWTNYSGYDPEVSVRNSALTPGFDYSAYPRARTLTLGLNAKF
ncbi:SusC/RagA family TonB-linked outer membrane protein [Desertivirga brevis]|uniref:SusC/RagA family TonB-linked outer membrane protein n=1 Tax=Desertivirga brevis TaxID=2810310 RepID=UPI001A965C9E|nr:TonB-dependent receptor [Pedobacter sp. SYSU D00873]